MWSASSSMTPRAILVTNSTASEISGFRSRRREYRFHRYDVLHGADRWHSGRHRAADAILAGDWRWKGHPSVAIEPPLDWDGLCANNRSWGLVLHSWEPLGISLAAHDNTGGSAHLDFALALALDWLDRFGSPGAVSSSLAWYDLAVGTRAYRLAYLLDVVARDPERGDEVVSCLLAGLRLHVAMLADEKRFAGHSNHGIYQIIGQLAMARRFPDLPEVTMAGEQGGNRLAALLDSHFTDEGVHLEHSPQYHRLVLIPLRALWKAGLVTDVRINALCTRIEEALAWFVTPARRFAMFGDTDRVRIAGSHADRYTSTSLAFAASGGAVGEPPSAVTKAFPESGYVVFRDRWPSGKSDFADCSYLAQTCAFHSRVHKHADDLSFVWYDKGYDILTDAGRFGYVGKTEPGSELAKEGFWYSDPRRIYVESTRAHNTVEIDGLNNPRRGVEPYRSALLQWGERDEVRFSESQIVRGPLSHTRLLLFLPRHWLIVVDYLADLSPERHDFTQRFHLAPELDLDSREGDLGSVSAKLPSGDALHAVGLVPQAAVPPVRGVEEPELLGWISPRDGVMEPQWTLGWKACAVSAFTFASLFCFGGSGPLVDPNMNRTDNDAASALFRWEAEDWAHTLTFERMVGQSFDIGYSRLAR